MSAHVAFIAPLELPFAYPGDVGELVHTVRPCGMGQIARLLAKAGTLVDELLSLPAPMVGRLQAGDLQMADIAYLYQLISDRGELGIELVAIAAALPQARVDALLPDRFAYLFALVVQVNADFFGRGAPVFQAAGALLAKAWAAPKAGPNPSTP